MASVSERERYGFDIFGTCEWWLWALYVFVNST